MNHEIIEMLLVCDGRFYILKLLKHNTSMTIFIFYSNTIFSFSYFQKKKKTLLSKTISN